MAFLAFRVIFVFTVATTFLGPVLRFTRALDIPDIEHPITPSLTLTAPAAELIVVKGQNATLKCPFFSTGGDVQVKWSFNGTPIPHNDSRWAELGDDDGALYIPKVTSGKKAGRGGVAGEYNCSVRNGAGLLVSGVTKVKIAAIDKEINQSTLNVTVAEFQPFLLECNVRSTPSAKIRWQIKSQLSNYLPLPQDTRYVPLPNGALLIPKSQFYHTGSYRCIAENVVLNKTKYSKDISVKILPLSPKTRVPLEFLTLGASKNVTALLGDNVAFACAAKGWPTPKIQWINDEDMIIGNSTVLKITNAKFNNTGNYTCMAMNSDGRIFEKYTLSVFEKPYFNVTPISTRSPSAKIVRLDCQAKGVPTPRLYWLKDGKLLKIEGRIKKQWSGLVFSHTFTHDSGMYQCVAENSVGKVWTSAEIQIQNSFSPPENVQCRTYDAHSICLMWRPPRNVKAKAYTVHSFYIEDEDLGEIAGPEYLTTKTSYLCDRLNDSTNYTFYVRLYFDTASDQSEKVTCRTGRVNYSRNLDVEQINSTTVLLKWNKLNTDTFCNGTRDSYKIFWRPWQRYDQVTTNGPKIFERKYFVYELLPGLDYEFKVIAENYEKESDVSWTLFPVRGIELSTSQILPLENDTVAVTHETVPETPTKLEAMATEVNVVELKWDSVANAKYYTVCYVAVKDNKSCDAGETLKTFAAKSVIPKLKTNTVYQFKVKAHNSKGSAGEYSDPIEKRTLQDVPSPVLNLKYKIINSTTACISWGVPTNKNGRIIKYVISYTPEPDRLLEKWLQFDVRSRASKYRPSCDISDENVISTYFGNLTEDKQYTVMVRAKNDEGLGKPTMPLYIKTAAVNFEKGDGEEYVDHENLHDQQKIGIIIGVILALTCIVCCVLCIVLRKRWLKRRASAQARLAAATNFYTPRLHYGPEPLGVVPQVRIEDRCGVTDLHEMERFLVGDGETTSHIPSNPGHIDSKGADQPNGSANGPNKPYLNGHVHITENPQYYAFQCNGNVTGKTKLPETSQHSFETDEEDPNSNVKSSKFYDLHRLFENTKKTKNRECDPHFTHGNTAIDDEDSAHGGGDSHEDVRSDTSSADVTRLTYLDQSILSNRSRRLSPLLGPNG